MFIVWLTKILFQKFVYRCLDNRRYNFIKFIIQEQNHLSYSYINKHPKTFSTSLCSVNTWVSLIVLVQATIDVPVLNNIYEHPLMHNIIKSVLNSMRHWGRLVNLSRPPKVGEGVNVTLFDTGSHVPSHPHGCLFRMIKCYYYLQSGLVPRLYLAGAVQWSCSPVYCPAELWIRQTDVIGCLETGVEMAGASVTP